MRVLQVVDQGSHTGWALRPAGRGLRPAQLIELCLRRRPILIAGRYCVSRKRHKHNGGHQGSNEEKYTSRGHNREVITSL